MNFRRPAYMFFGLLFLGALSISSQAQAAREVTTFEIPDVNDDFCGPQMQVAFCRCAFEGEGCDVVKMEQGAVRDFIEREYKEWVGERIATVANECLANDGYWNTPTRQCFTCTEGEVRDGKECLPPGSTPTTPTASQCALAASFAQDWQALSDFAKTEGEVSEPVSNYRARFDELLFSVRNAAQYQQQLALTTSVLGELRRYKTALRDGVALDRDTAFSGLVSLNNAPLPPETTGIMTALAALFDTEGFSSSVAEQFLKASTTETTMLFVVPTKETLEADLKPGTAHERIMTTITGLGNEVGGVVSNYLSGVVTLPFSEADSAFMQTEHHEAGLVDAVYAATAAKAAVTRKALLAEQTYFGGIYNETENLRKAEYERVATSVTASCQQQ